MPARVILVSTYYHPVIGGAEAVAGRFATYLRARGHRILVITKRTSAADLEHDRIDDVEVWRRPPIGPRSNLGKWLFMPSVSGALWAKRAEYDVICVFDQRATGIPALMVARLLGRPLVIQPQTQATLDGRHPLKHGWRAALHRALSWPVRWCYTRADAIACITRSIITEGQRMRVDASRLHYLPNPVDIRRFSPVDRAQRLALRSRYGLPLDAVLFAFTGRLSREKGIRELLTAWKRASRAGIHLAIIGPDMDAHDWNEGPWARDFVSREGLAETVTFLGGRPHAEVAELQSASDAAVLPSHFEAHPVAAIEAMAAGLPLIASNVGGVPDFLVDGTNGLLVEPRDVDGLVRALDRVATDSAWRQTAGEAARRTAERFSVDVVLEEFAGLIDRLAARTARRG